MIWKKKKWIQQKFFVSIGAGINQTSLISEAKNLGFYVIGVDRDTNAPGFNHCNLKIHESIENYNEIYKKIRELLLDGDISAIMTKSYGKAVKTASFLTEKYNIPFLPFSRSTDFINKKKMKSIFKKNHINSPRTFTFTKKSRFEKLNKNMFPIVYKPDIGHAKIDIRLIKNLSELKMALQKSSKTSKSIFEQYINGDEIIAFGIIFNKRYHLVDITDKKITPPPFFVDLMHISPSKYYYLSDKISEIGQATADAFEISTSPLVMELIVKNNENIYLIEAVPEFGGEYISDVIIPSRTRLNFIRETIKAMTNKGFKGPPKNKLKNAVVVKYITGEKGVLTSFNPGGPGNIKGVLFSKIFKKIGSNIKNPVNNLDRIGVVAVKAGTIEEAIDTAENASKSLKIKIVK